MPVYSDLKHELPPGIELVLEQGRWWVHVKMPTWEPKAGHKPHSAQSRERAYRMAVVLRHFVTQVMTAEGLPLDLSHAHIDVPDEASG